MVKFIYNVYLFISVLIIIITNERNILKYIDMSIFYKNNSSGEIIFYRKSLREKFKKWNCNMNSSAYQRYDTYYNFSNVIYRSDFKVNENLKCSIFGMIYDYSINQTIVFLNSLKNTEFDGKIYFMVNENISQNEIEHYSTLNIELIYISNDYPYYSTKNTKYHIRNSILKRNFRILNCTGRTKLILIRYLMVLSFLQSYRHMFNYILFTDTRDVLFQSNPFSFDINNGITLFEETRLKMWKNSGFSVNLNKTTKKYLDKVFPYPIINCGVIFMTINEGLKFLLTFKTLVLNSKNSCPNDQAIVNIIAYAIHKNYKIYIFPNGFGPVKTMANERNEFNCSFPEEIRVSSKKNIYLNKNNQVLMIGGNTYLLVHSNHIWMKYREVMEIRNSYLY